MTEAILVAQPTGIPEAGLAGQPARGHFAAEELAANLLERTAAMPSVSLLHSVPPPAHDEHVTAVYRYAVGSGIADLPAHANVLTSIFTERTIRARHAGHAGFFHHANGRYFVAHHANGFGFRPDEYETALFNAFRKVCVFR